MIQVRPAMTLDCASMAQLLNEIIQIGGTTALTRPVTGTDLAEWMQDEPDRSAWHVAVNAEEAVVGFQWIAPNASLPEGAADIATFVQVGQTGLGIGSALFAATAKAAKLLGYRWINATIRADNTGGLTYYQSRGFRDWRFDEDVTLESGQRVDKISKRYDL
ncbi:GNAT family N-acetyltransferase [Roseobacter sinensis]|uniref:GNAT family N-acetyltransferase n=1 Tax=Roseobacter sinensis TaxID=2931391 RepID=A0ABT3B8T7_9RHOB|nr:GNAT family N-acetyltransferase [Roseobacter sp. WL0113]MCV3269986.1 GNAT family N-acetyltransferase [Roseobacter sp. WL0113]